jgi:hypothetical protein
MAGLGLQAAFVVPAQADRWPDRGEVAVARGFAVVALFVFAVIVLGAEMLSCGPAGRTRSVATSHELPGRLTSLRRVTHIGRIATLSCIAHRQRHERMLRANRTVEDRRVPG